MNIKPPDYCIGCGYLSRTGTCDYILITGTRRPCKPGKGCVMHSQKGAKMRMRTWDTARAEALQAEGKTALEIAEMVGASVATVKQYFRKQWNVPAMEAAPEVEPEPVDVQAQAPTAVPEQVPIKGMLAAALADILHDLADQYPDAEVSFDERPVRRVYLDVSFGGDGVAPAAVITMR